MFGHPRAAASSAASSSPGGDCGTARMDSSNENVFGACHRHSPVVAVERAGGLADYDGVEPAGGVPYWATAFDNAVIEAFWSRMQVELLDR